MWEERAHCACREIAALASTGLGVTELHAETIRVIGSTVSAELSCCAAIDPETLVISTMVSGDTRIPPAYESRLGAAEYSPEEPHRFAALAARKSTVARLSDLPGPVRDRSARLNHVWRPLGLDREVRVVFLVDGACWGAAGLVRAGRDFTDRETEFLAAVAPTIAAATRLAVRSEAAGQPGNGSPAIVILGPSGELRSATPAALEWQRGLDELAPDRFDVMMRVMASGARAAGSAGFRARLRDARGRWAVLEASALVGDDDQIAVSIEPATGDRSTSLLLVAYGLTLRERDVCREVLAGRSTAEIAARLFITVHTVQDHLKSVFAKVGVGSRRELVAVLRPHVHGAGQGAVLASTDESILISG